MTTVVSTPTSERPEAAPVPGPSRRRPGRAWLFLLPLLTVNGLVIAGPTVASVGYSFTDWSGFGAATWVGLENYRSLLESQPFRQAFVHNVVWTAIFLTVPISMGLVGAYLLSRVRRLQVLFRVAFFVPYILASVVNAAIWRNLLDPERGIFAAVAGMGWRAAGEVNLLGSTSTSLLTVAFVDNWHWWGFLVVIFLTAMRDIDPSIYEACRLDGASSWQEFRHITVPSIRPTLTFVALMTVIWSFLSFDYVFILTGGGPAGSSEVLSTLIYREAFSNLAAGSAAAMSMGLALTSLVVGAVFLLLRRRAER